ncbi:retropepsin-like aspartic protease [[Mycoplasma] mobile]|uniref:Expressed protein n=1 Tax=Mycoplasma mobile (strain ATCC 43663 / 163K / NCTC 11711) TaxID=267748 RepID=Q6KIR1_MYCM1|nr:retropepsin-like aspartic protease [[Mycoplasma] mobile]AAT27515.1 expressed protein [Mycoplasma mobile 163K]
MPNRIFQKIHENKIIIKVILVNNIDILKFWKNNSHLTEKVNDFVKGKILQRYGKLVDISQEEFFKILNEDIPLWSKWLEFLKSIEKYQKEIFALIDTGATSSAISQEIANELGLISIGKSSVQTASNRLITSKYLVSLSFLTESTLLLPSIEKNFQEKSFYTNKLVPFEQIIEVTSLENLRQSQNIDMLIGMDILKNTHFTIFSDNAMISV